MNLKQVFSIILLSGAMALSTISCKSKVSDTDLKAKVETAVSNPNVLVDVKDGVVTLSGTVNSEDEKIALETSVKSADKKGVKSVVNNVTVQEAIVINTDDVDLAAKVVDATKDFPEIQATVNDGVITITGSVEQSRIQTLKQSLDGLNPKKVDLSAITIK